MESLVVTGFSFACNKDFNEFQAILGKIMPKVAGVRRFGSAALDLAYVAAGRFEAYWESEIHPWDVAAGIILVQEAGGYVTDLTGSKQMFTKSSILAANDSLHDVFLKIITE